MRPSAKEAHARLMILKYVVAHAASTPPKELLAQVGANWGDAERAEFDVSFGHQADAFVKSLRKLGLWKYTSPKERAFLSSSGLEMDDYARLAASWRSEAAGMLMWALRLIEPWPKIDEQISPDHFKGVAMEKVGVFTNHPSLRPYEELSDKRGLVELWHWRVRTRQLIEEGHPFTADEKLKQAGIESFDDIVRFTAKGAHESGDLPEILEEDFVFLGKPFRALTADEYQTATSIIMERHYALNWLCGLAPRNKWDETPTDT